MAAHPVGGVGVPKTTQRTVVIRVEAASKTVGGCAPAVSDRLPRREAAKRLPQAVAVLWG